MYLLKFLKQNIPRLREMVQLVFVTRATRWSDWGLLTLVELHVGQAPSGCVLPCGGLPRFSAADHEPVLSDFCGLSDPHWESPAPVVNALSSLSPPVLWYSAPLCCAEGTDCSEIQAPSPTPSVLRPLRSMEPVSPQCGLSLLSH